MKEIKKAVYVLLGGISLPLVSCGFFNNQTTTSKENPTTTTESPTTSETPSSVVPTTSGQSSFLVTFNYGYNNITTISVVNAGEKLNKPANPKRDNYSFDNWYTDSNFTTVYDFNTPVSQGFTLYAKWDGIWNVTFENTSLDSVTVTDGDKVTKPADSSVAKEGYEFNGWYKEASFTNVFDFNTEVITSDTSIYAKYTINTYTIEFDSNGGSDVTTQTIEYNSKVTKPTDPVKADASFKGWYTSENGGVTLSRNPYDFNLKVTSDFVLYAKWDSTNPTISLVSEGGYNEGLYIEFTTTSGKKASDYQVKYKLHSETNYKTLDSELIRDLKNNNIRFDIVGISKGSYDVKIYDGTNLMYENTLGVLEHDRSGYAHFNSSTGVGAYNNDGTLKDNAVVVYVTETNKNTVRATINGSTKTGLAAILKAATNESIPVVIRIIGRVSTKQWNYIDTKTVYGEGNKPERLTTMNALLHADSTLSKWDTTKSSNYDRLYEDNIIELGFNSMSNDSAIEKLNGLSTYISWQKKSGSGYSEFDSYFNMLDLTGIKNVTIEGIGKDAEIFQWGFNFSKCNSIEVRNLTFTDYTEDAVGIQGGSNSDMDYSRFWIHQCTFNKGKNNWDVSYENDKKEGDGSTDFKYAHNLTISYTRYNSTHKSCLIGSSDSALQYNVTLHHNFYNQCESRLPLLRQANVHMYNNYYYKCSTAQDIRANAFALSEANCFENCSKAQKVTTSSSYAKTVIKSVGDYYIGSGNTTQATKVARTDELTGLCKPDGTTNYTNFDTNQTLFYYDSVNHKSDVMYLTDASTAKTDCMAYSGAGYSWDSENNQ